MKNTLFKTIACLLLATNGREMTDDCEINDPKTCDQTEKGGCCMEWKGLYHSDNNFLYIEKGR